MKAAGAQLSVPMKVLSERKAGEAAPKPAGARACGSSGGLNAESAPARGRPGLAPSPKPRGLGPGAHGRVSWPATASLR